MLRTVCDVFGISSSSTVLTAASVNCNLCFTQKRGRRRVLKAPPWIPPKDCRVKEFLDQDTGKLLEQVIEQEKSGVRPAWAEHKSPLINRTWEREGETAPKWTPESCRVGLVARKIGMLPQWLNDGTRILCTLLEFPDNQVVSAVDPETWYRYSLVGKRKAFNRYGAFWKVTVGAVNGNPSHYTHVYRSIFDRQGLPVKENLRSFLVSEDAIVPPGTPLHVCHFSVGQYITVTGKTIDWGFQGVVHRWGMKGGPAVGPTKSHRRVGSIGAKGDARVWPGRRLPGHMGWEWVTVSGLEVVRINPQKQVLYVKGSVPGEVGEILLVKDCMQPDKRVKDPPFPTFFPFPEGSQAEPTAEQPENAVVTGSGDIYSKKLFRFSSPSVVFTVEDETKLSARDKTRAKLAKVKK